MSDIPVTVTSDDQNDVAISNPKLQGKVEEEAAKFVLGLWQTHITQTNEYRNKLVKWYKQYRGIPGRRNYEGLANVFVNETLQATESIVAQIYSTIYSQPKRFWAKPKKETGEKALKLAEDLVICSLDHMGDKAKVKRSMYQCVKYGTTFAKIPRKFEKKVMTFRKEITDPMTGVAGSQYVTEPKVTYDDADLEYIDLLDIAIDPGKASIDEMDWIVVHKRVTYDTLVARARNLNIANLDKLQRPDAKNNKSDATTNNLKNQRMSSIGINYDQIENGDYDLYECWALVPRWWVDSSVDINSDDAAALVEAVIEVVQTSGTGGVTIRCEPNPYWHQEKPFVMAKYIEVDGETYGMGVCEVSEYLQQELNDKRNQALDWVSFNIFPMLEVLRSANIDKSSIKKVPHALVESDIKGGINPVPLGGNIQGPMLMDNVQKQDIRNQTAATNSVQGVDVQGTQTAYEVNTLERRGASKISMYTAAFGETFLKPFYTYCYKLHQQYTTTDQAVRKVGQRGVEWIKYTPEDLISDYDFIPIIPTDSDNRLIVLNQLIQFIGQIGKFYPQVNAYRLVRKIYMLFGFDDADQIIPEPQSDMGINDLTIQQKIQVLSTGEKIVVNWWDNHLRDLSALQQFMDANQANLTPQAVKAFQDAMMQHMIYLQNAQMAAQAQAPAAGGGANPQVSSPSFSNNPTQPMSNSQRQTMNPMAAA